MQSSYTLVLAFLTTKFLVISFTFFSVEPLYVSPLTRIVCRPTQVCVRELFDDTKELLVGDLIFSQTRAELALLKGFDSSTIIILLSLFSCVYAEGGFLSIS